MEAFDEAVLPGTAGVDVDDWKDLSIETEERIVVPINLLAGITLALGLGICVDRRIENNA